MPHLKSLRTHEIPVKEQPQPIELIVLKVSNHVDGWRKWSSAQSGKADLSSTHGYFLLVVGSLGANHALTVQSRIFEGDGARSQKLWRSVR